jgi:hypothetical protein
VKSWQTCGINGKLRRILVGYDGSVECERALAAAIALGEGCEQAAGARSGSSPGARTFARYECTRYRPRAFGTNAETPSEPGARRGNRDRNSSHAGPSCGRNHPQSPRGSSGPDRGRTPGYVEARRENLGIDRAARAQSRSVPGHGDEIGWGRHSAAVELFAAQKRLRTAGDQLMRKSM